MLKIGLDIGSTTIKCVVLDQEDQILFSDYQRHYSQITQKTGELLAGLGLALGCGIPFVL